MNNFKAPEDGIPPQRRLIVIAIKFDDFSATATDAYLRNALAIAFNIN